MVVARGSGPHARRPATEEESKALASPLRMRILRLCRYEPQTNKELATALGKDPASVLHHVRTLVDTEFLRALPPRRGTRGSREIPYQATGKSWTLSAAGQSKVMLEAFLEDVSAVPAEDIDASRLGMQLDAAGVAEFKQRLQDLLDEFVARPSDAGDDRWSVFVAVHPEPRP